jgi:hypothetical protein
MRIIHNTAFSDDERSLFRTALGSNIITGLRYMMSLAEQEGKLEISKKVRRYPERGGLAASRPPSQGHRRHGQTPARLRCGRFFLKDFFFFFFGVRIPY